MVDPSQDMDHVLLLTDTLELMGGAERNLSILATQLRARHYKVSVACLKGGIVSEKLKGDGFPVHALHIGRIYSPRGLKGILRIIAFVRQKKISAVLTYHESSDIIGALITLFTGVPVVSSRRDLGFNLKRRHILFYRFINPLFAAITTVSVAVRDAVINTQGTNPSKITVIYNGVDPELFSRSSNKKEEHNKVNNKVNICCLANIRLIKGHKYLLKAIDLIKNHNLDFCLHLIGRFEEQDDCYQELQEIIRSRQLEDYVVFTGAVPGHEVFAQLQKMDISVLASLSEGMPNTLLESMAAGLPVVATAVGGSAEVVKQGETGFLVPEGDVQKLADALLALIEDSSVRQYMGEKAVQRFTAMFSAETMTDRYEDIIRYVILKKQKQSLYNKWAIESFYSSLKQYWKCFVATALFYGKIIAIFQILKQLNRRGRVLVLCLHDIVDAKSKWLLFDVSIFSEHFSKIIDVVTNSYQVLNLEQACSLIENGTRMKEDVVAITFDDCYSSYTGTVFKKCSKENIPYTVFLNSYPLDKQEFLLYDLLIYISTSTWRKVADVPFIKDQVFLLDSKSAVRFFVATLFQNLQVAPFVVWRKVINDLADYFDVDLENDKLSDHFLSWDDVRNLHKSGVTIGAHTVTHPLLSAITEKEGYQEIYECKQRLEEELNFSINFFAYPYGHKNSYNEKTIQLVKQCGFQFAFTLEGKEKFFPPFAIGRRNVSPGQFLSGNGSFCRALFELELSGLGDIIFGRRLRKSAVYEKNSTFH